MYKKVISAALSAALLLGAVGTPCMADADGGQRGERVTVIVETEGVPLLKTKNAVRLGASEFMKTDEAKEANLRLMDVQKEVRADVERRVNGDADAGFTYTGVINGFSMEAYSSDIEKIKSVDGVKNVYIAPTVWLPEEPEAQPMEVKAEPSFGAQMMNAPAMYDAGYDGRGQAIAVIDADFDTAHEFFSSPVENPRLSKDDIRNFIENNKLNANVEVDQVYKSPKIPFAYDYVEKDADTFDAQNEHGSHIAGIAAGKNGVFGGVTFSGVAPEAQIIMMKAIDSRGGVSFDTVMAAMDDASKMDICVLNMSIGATYAEIPLFEEAVDNMRAAGIIVTVAAGNADRGGEQTDDPDYAYNDLPATYHASTSVASVDANKRWVFNGKMTLGNGEEIVTSIYDDLFFEKFSDGPYKYVYVTTENSRDVDMKGKIVVTPIFSGVSSIESLDRGAIGIIAISEGENDREVLTASEEIPGIIVRKSYGEKLINCEPKTLKTEADPLDGMEESPNVGMSDFTSWGTGATLELKPEITAPGGNILSAVNNDKYKTKTGTSMSAPQIAGAVALMNGLADDKFPNITGSERAALLENILMSSASLVFQDPEKTLPESPRRQGAGLADLKAAKDLPVILLGDSGKTKLSLKDQLTDEIPLVFTAKNLTDKDVVYDDVKLYVFTDGYEESDGKSLIAGSTPLNFTSDAPESVTVPANGEITLTVNVKLDSAQTARNKEVFINGFWVDGFVVLSSKDGLTVKSSLPFTGFYGDWTAFDALLPSYFERGGSSRDGGISLYDSDSGTYTLLGKNKFYKEEFGREEYDSEDYVGLSAFRSTPYYLRVCSLRSLVNVTLTTRDQNDDIVAVSPQENGLTRQEEERDYMDILSLGRTTLPEGDYTYTLKGRFAYDSGRSRSETKTYKFYVDSTPPEISNPRVFEENGEKFAAFNASDNRYLMGAEAGDDEGGYTFMAVKPTNSAEIVLNVTDLEDDFEITVYDYAYNRKSFKVGTVKAEIIDTVKEDDDAAFIVRVTNDSADAIDADVVMALYSEDGRLLDAKIRNVEIRSGAKKTVAFSLNGAVEAEEARLFVWRHGEVTPVCKPAYELAL